MINARTVNPKRHTIELGQPPLRSILKKPHSLDAYRQAIPQRHTTPKCQPPLAESNYQSGTGLYFCDPQSRSISIGVSTSTRDTYFNSNKQIFRKSIFAQTITNT